MIVKAGSRQSTPWNDERLFAICVTIGTLVFGAGFGFLLLAMNHREDFPAAGTGEGLADSASHLILPDFPRQLVDFALTDRTGRTVTRADLAGRVLVVDFLFTGCSLTCPAVNRQMAQIQKQTTNRPEVMLVSLTVDPRDDTPEVLEKYGERFGADTNRWLFLTGDKTQLYRLIESSFLASDTNGIFGYMPGNFAHTERIAIVGPSGHLRGYFDGLNPNTATAVINELTKLKNETL